MEFCNEGNIEAGLGATGLRVRPPTTTGLGSGCTGPGFGFEGAGLGLTGETFISLATNDAEFFCSGLGSGCEGVKVKPAATKGWRLCAGVEACKTNAVGVGTAG